MKILVVNCGSSSVKFGLFDIGASDREILSGQVEKIGEAASRLSYVWRGGNEKHTEELTAADHRQAFAAIFEVFRRLPGLATPDAIGHRVVHGGELFGAPVRVDAEVYAQIQALNPLAPLHNPVNLLGIEICGAAFPETPQVAVFDTAFHQTLPAFAYRYAVPEDWYREHGIRRYGFHGASHQYLARQAARHLGKPLNSLKLITLHLGNGASAAAVRFGHSVDTSMGFTPLEGLVMGSRSGDLDPMAALQAVELSGLEDTRYALMNRSGLKGLCGGNDLRDILAQADAGDPNAQLALDVYVYRIRKYLGAYFAILGGIDALVFAGGVGENASAIREKVCADLECLGMALDKTANAARVTDEPLEIQAAGNSLKILVIRTQEEQEIARQTAALIGLADSAA